MRSRDRTTKHLVPTWLDSMLGILDPKTVKSYVTAFKSHLYAAFPTIDDITTSNWRTYIKTRLAAVKADTVRKELSPMRGFVDWLVEEKALLAESPHLPGIPKRAVGTSYGKRRRAKPDELSEEEIGAIIAALPEWSEEIGPVRARFQLQYAEGLRSHTLDKLSKPEHWREGSEIPDLAGRYDEGAGRAEEAAVRGRCVSAEVGLREPARWADIRGTRLPGAHLSGREVGADRRASGQVRRNALADSVHNPFPRRGGSADSGAGVRIAQASHDYRPLREGLPAGARGGAAAPGSHRERHEVRAKTKGSALTWTLPLVTFINDFAGAKKRTRTSTPLLALEPESSFRVSWRAKQNAISRVFLAFGR